jgi:hypothetical protein
MADARMIRFANRLCTSEADADWSDRAAVRA